MLRDKIAIDAACFDIETNCGDPDDEGWYNLAAIPDPDRLRLILESVEFLTGIDRIEQHPLRAHLVKPIRHRQQPHPQRDARASSKPAYRLEAASHQ